MSHIFADNVREGSVTEGTGDFTTEGGIPSPGGIIVGRALSEVLLQGDTFDYSIFHSSLNEWEIGIGTYIAPNTFSRTPSSSSNGGSLVDFSPGTKQVFIAPVAARMGDTISDDRLPQTQSGKIFTSTVSVTGVNGLSVIYDHQEWGIGVSHSALSDLATVLRNRDNNTSTYYVDTDKLPNGFSIRFHQSGSNVSDALTLTPDGALTSANLTITSGGTGRLGSNDIKTVSSATEPETTTFPLGHTVLVIRDDGLSRNRSRAVRISNSNSEEYVTTGSGDILTGTWRSRGRYSGLHLMERMA